MTEGKKIKQYELNGSSLKLINEYNSISEASMKTGIARNSIKYVLDNKRKSAGGYYWKYNDGKQYPITEISQKTPIPIAQIEIYNGFVHCIYPSIQEASRQTGINSSMISQCLNGTIANTGYWKWSYVTNLTNDQKISSQYKNSPYRLTDNAIKGKSIFEMTDKEYELFLKEIEENFLFDR